MKIDCQCGSKRGKKHIRVGVVTGTSYVTECKKCGRKSIDKTY